MTSSVFVSYRPFLTGSGGGVQVCTQEYVKVLETAGYQLRLVLFDQDRRVSTRVLRRLFSSPYNRPVPSDLAQRVIAEVRATSAEVVFLNQVALAAIAPEIKRILPGTKIVVLSHGLESTDLVHAARLRGRLPAATLFAPAAEPVLGHVLVNETKLRSSVDAVCTLSPSDADLERWMGARHVCWIPRSVEPELLDWTPVRARFGFVGTLDHPPNLEGLAMALDALQSMGGDAIRVRLVGGPRTVSERLSRDYGIIEPLGVLDDDALKAEAATWSAFLHPIFSLARGCSTKLATALSWGIPVVTTDYGRRGYVWAKGDLTIGNSPFEFAHECNRLLDLDVAGKARAAVIEVAKSTPKISDNALEVKTFLLNSLEQRWY